LSKRSSTRPKVDVIPTNIEITPALGMSLRMVKMASSKARGEREPEAYPQGYVEDSVEPRTKLEGIFTILLT
jgi:hypothetical protein